MLFRSERRAQLQRAQARRLLHLARALGQLDGHRGGQLGALGRALLAAFRGLQPTAPNGAHPAPPGTGAAGGLCPQCREDVQGTTPIILGDLDVPHLPGLSEHMPGKMEGDTPDEATTDLLRRGEEAGLFHQTRKGVVETTPIILGGVNALHLPAFYEKLGHSNVILAAGGGAFGHKDGPKQGAMACRQGEEAWTFWRAGNYGGVRLSDGIIAYAKTHEEIRGAFLTFPKAADQIYPGWRQQLGYTGKTSLPVPMVAPAAHTRNVCSAVDQSSRYADLSLVEKDLVKNGKHVLVGFCMVPQAGCGYLDTAARFAAEYSTGTDDQENSSAVSMRIADALVYYVDPDKEEMRIAYPCLLFDRNITDGRAMRSLLSMLSIGSNQGMGGVQEGLVVDFYLPPSFLKLLDGPSCNISNVWCTLRRSTPYVGLVDLQPRPFSEAFYAFWQGGVCLQSDRAQGHPVFCQSQEFIPAVAQAMQACILADVGIQRGAVQGCGLLLAPHGTHADPSSVGSSAGTVDLAMQNTSVHVQHGEAGLPPMGVEAAGPLPEGPSWNVDGVLAQGQRAVQANLHVSDGAMAQGPTGHAALAYGSQVQGSLSSGASASMDPRAERFSLLVRHMQGRRKKKLRLFFWLWRAARALRPWPPRSA